MATSPVPAMDSPSVAFAWFLDSMVVEDAGPGADDYPALVCRLCNTEVCYVEDGDTLRVLLNTALQHTCPGAKH